MDFQEQVRQIKREIKELYKANATYRKKRSTSPGEKYAQELRGQRLKQILDELAQIVNRKKP
jgi:hypothetical protein